MNKELFDPKAYAISQTPPERLEDIEFVDSVVKAVRSAEREATSQKQLHPRRGRQSQEKSRK